MVRVSKIYKFWQSGGSSRNSCIRNRMAKSFSSLPHPTLFRKQRLYHATPFSKLTKLFSGMLLSMGGQFPLPSFDVTRWNSLEASELANEKTTFIRKGNAMIRLEFFLFQNSNFNLFVVSEKRTAGT